MDTDFILPVVVTRPDERHATEQLLCWSGKTDTEQEHSTTSSSNEEEEGVSTKILRLSQCFSKPPSPRNFESFTYLPYIRGVSGKIQRSLEFEWQCVLF